MSFHGIHAEPFGTTTEGVPVERFTITNQQGLSLRVVSYGAMLTELQTPDRTGRLANVVLGFDQLESYLKGHPHFGSTIGRVGNRIARGHFTLNGKTYQLATNNGPNHLHGGLVGFGKRVWQPAIIQHPLGPAVQFSYASPDGEESYPGNVTVSVTYILTDQNEWRLEYSATTDQPTPVNLTNHAYFNLKDAGQSDILGHVLEIMADQFTPVDATSIPTGEIRAVDDIMSFQSPTAIGARIDRLRGDPGGYDHNYVLRKSQPGALELAARAYDPGTGRVLEILTTEPGIQFYTGNYLNGTLTGHDGAVYGKRHGFCLETQHYPDSVNHPSFPSTILLPGQTYRQTTVHRFSVRGA